MEATSIIDGLAQYGPLGLWTASLLWMNWQQRQDAKEEEKRLEEAIKHNQEHVVESLRDQKHLLEKVLEEVKEIGEKG